MLFVLLSWLFVCAVVLPYGIALMRAVSAMSAQAHYKTSLAHVLLLGMVAITGVATLLNILIPLDQWALLVACLLSLLLWGFFRKEFIRQLRSWKSNIWKKPTAFWIGLSCLVVIALVKTASPTESIDEGRYYLPYLRWIEQFQLTPGIANIEDRFGFNSSFHILSALFSYSWMGHGGWYDLSGLTLIIIGGLFVEMASGPFRKGNTILLSQYASVLCLIFLMRNRLTTPSADLPVMLLAELVVLMFLQKIETKSLGSADLSFFLILTYLVHMVTVKYNMLFFGLLGLVLIMKVAKPGNKVKWAQIGVLGGLILIPWLIRFPIITGYLVFPIYQIDLLDVDWKLPEKVIKTQYHYVSEYAKTNALMEESEFLAEQRGISEWFPVWFIRENLVNQGTFVLLCLCIAFGLVRISWQWASGKYPSIRDLLFFILLFNVGIWFFKTPTFRFGWASIILIIAIVTHSIIKLKISPRPHQRLVLLLYTLFFALNTIKSTGEAWNYMPEVVIAPAPVPTIECQTVQMGDFEVLEAPGNFCWGSTAPCFNSGAINRVMPRGERPEDGFRPKH